MYLSVEVIVEVSVKSQVAPFNNPSVSNRLTTSLPTILGLKVIASCARVFPANNAEDII